GVVLGPLLPHPLARRLEDAGDRDPRLGHSRLPSCRRSSRRSKLPCQNRRYRSSHSRASCSGAPSRREGRSCAERPRAISPARSSTLRCLETAWTLIGNGSASSFTDASPSTSRARIARRVGSASAAKVAGRGSAALFHLL